MRIFKQITPLLAFALAWTGVAHLQGAVVVQPPGAIIAGKTIGQWTASWWQWAAALAPPGDPFTDATGEFANVNQSGPVFFLAGSPGGSRSRHFEVPANTYLLVPLLVGEWSQLELGFDETAAQIRQAAQQQANMFDSLHATLDGTAIPQATLFTHRQVSPDFNFVAVAGNRVNINGVGPSGIAVADGYFLMLAPLTPGTHVLNYGGGASAFGNFIDETDTITVLGPPPTITAQPTNQAVFTGSNATFSVSATTTNPPIRFQWQFNGVNLFRATNNTLTISNAQMANIGDYQVLVSDAGGSTNSTRVHLSLIDLPPFIASQPNSLEIPAGSNATFTVIAGGAAPLFYQWRFNQANIADATQSTLVITNVQPGQAGNYTVVITNNYGAVTSSIATLRLLAWIRIYNGPASSFDSPAAVAVDSSGNVVVTGQSFNQNNADFYTAKYAAANGTLFWEKRYNGPADSDDQARAVAVDGSGNVVVTGYSVNGDSTVDSYTAKYAAANGALLWEKRYNGPANNYDDAFAVAVDSSGNVVVTGQSLNQNDGDYYPAKYAAANGALLWEKRYNGPANGADWALAMAVDGSGNVVVTGQSYNQTDGDYYTAKYAAANGALLWEKRYNGAGNSDDFAYAVAVDGSGNVVVTGSSVGSSGTADYYTAKYAAASGALLWERRHNGLTNSDEAAYAVAVDGSGNVVVTGSSATIKYLTNGTAVWTNNTGGSAIAADGSGNVVVTGNSQGDSSTTTYRAADGAVLSNYRHGNSFVSYLLALDAQGNVIVAGGADDNYLTLKIQTALPEIPSYRFTSIAFTNGSVQLAWTPAPGVLLQRTTSLTPPDWQTVSGSTNTNRIVISATGASGFFQLIKP